HEVGPSILLTIIRTTYYYLRDNIPPGYTKKPVDGPQALLSHGDLQWNTNQEKCDLMPYVKHPECAIFYERHNWPIKDAYKPTESVNGTTSTMDRYAYFERVRRTRWTSKSYSTEHC
ncbi:hypothetical protein BGZ49_005777, partial [Haplosporangium sp. Z 27]